MLMIVRGVKNMELKGKIALITGSGRGLGKAMALALAKHGCSIIINDRGEGNEEALQTVKELKGLGVESEYLSADVADFESCKKLSEAVKEKFGRVDILVNNAGFGLFGFFKDTDIKTEIDMINLNITALTALTKCLLPQMLKNKNGKIFQNIYIY